jgi:hypothetical protein
MLGALERESGQAGRLSSAVDSKGRTALHLAIAALDVSLVRRLVDAVSAACGVTLGADRLCRAGAASGRPLLVLCAVVNQPRSTN